MPTTPISDEETQHLLPKEEIEKPHDDNFPTPKPYTALDIEAPEEEEEAEAALETRFCPRPVKVAVPLLFIIAAIYSSLVRSATAPFLPPPPTITLDLISGSATHFHNGSAEFYNVEDFAATFSVRNDAVEAFVFSQFQIEMDCMGCDTSYFYTKRFESRVFEQPGGGGGAAQIQFAMPNATVKVAKWSAKLLGPDNSSVSVGLTNLRLTLFSTVRYKGKAKPEEIKMVWCCGWSSSVALLEAAKGMTRRLELVSVEGNVCYNKESDWGSTRSWHTFFAFLFIISVPLSFCFTLRPYKIAAGPTRCAACDQLVPRV